MSTFTDAVARYVTNEAIFHAWLHGPASGVGSIVDFGGGLMCKTPARMAAEAAVYETVQAIAIVSHLVAIDVSLGSVITTALNADITTLTITGAQAGKATSFIWELTADGTPRAITLPGTVTAMYGPYVPSSTNTKRDRLLLDTLDGTNWRLWVLAQNF